MGSQCWGRSAVRQAATSPPSQGAIGEGSQAHDSHQAASKGQSTHSQFDIRWLECWGALGFRGSGFTHTAQAIRVDAAKATYRLSRRQNAATEMMAHAQGGGAKNIDPAFRHHRQVVLALATGVSTQCRRRSEGRWPGSATTCVGTDAATTFVHTLLRLGWSAHHPQRHEDRPLGGGAENGGAEDGGFLGGSGFTDVVRQLCTLESLQGTAFLGSHQAASCFWQVGGVVTLASQRAGSSWFRVAFGRRSGLRVSGERKKTAASSATKAQAMFHRCCECPPCRPSGTCKSRRRCHRLHVLWGHNTGNSLQTAFLHALLPFCQQVHSSGHYRLPDGILEGHIFTDGSSSGSGAIRRARWAVVAVDNAGNLKAAACGAVPSDVLPGQTSRDAETNAAGHVTMAMPWATQRDVEAGRTTYLFERGNDCADIFAKKGTDTHKPAFRVAKTVVSLAKQAARWAAKAHVLLMFRGWDDTRAAASRVRTRPPRARLNRKGKAKIAAPASGATGFHPSFLHASRKTVISTHALSEGTAFDCGSRALDRAIIFCANCGDVCIQTVLWLSHAAFHPNNARSHFSAFGRVRVFLRSGKRNVSRTWSNLNAQRLGEGERGGVTSATTPRLTKQYRK